jgi:hypothetical protein
MDLAQNSFHSIKSHLKFLILIDRKVKTIFKSIESNSIRNIYNIKLPLFN